MAFSTANIYAGPARIQYDLGLTGAVDDPDESANWTDLGFTSEGLTVNFESNVEPFHVDQVAVPVHPIFGLIRATASVNIAESRLDAIRIATSGARATTITPDTQGLGFGSCDDDPLAPFRIRFIGDGPGGAQWNLIFFKAIAIGNVEQAFTRTAVRMIPTEIEAQSNGVNPLWLIKEI